MTNQTDAGNDDVMFSRTGFVGPYGPLLSEFKTRVDIDADLMFRRMCAEAGTDPASVIRNWINEQVRGVSYDDACFHAAKSRAAHLSRKGPIQARQSAERESEARA